MVSENFLMPLEKALKAAESALRANGFKILLVDINIGLIKAVPLNNSHFRHSRISIRVTTDNYKNCTLTLDCGGKSMMGFINPFVSFEHEEEEIMEMIRKQTKTPIVPK